MIGSRQTPEHQEEIAKLYAAYKARQEESWRKETGDTKLQISLSAAADDAPPFSPEYQAELHRFIEQVRAGGLEIQSFGMAMDAVDAQGGIIGEFLIPLAQAIGPTLGVVLVAWLNGRSGRRAQLKFGDIDVQGRTPAEIDELLKVAAKFRDQKSNAGKDQT